VPGAAVFNKHRRLQQPVELQWVSLATLRWSNRLLQIHGSAAVQDWSPRLGTSHVATLDDWSQRRVRSQSSAEFCGDRPLISLWTGTASLNSIRCRSNRKRSRHKTGTMHSSRRVTRRDCGSGSSFDRQSTNSVYLAYRVDEMAAANYLGGEELRVLQYVYSLGHDCTLDLSLLSPSST